MNSSLRLAFLLMVEGLFFFFFTPGPIVAIPLVFKEKVKDGPMAREK